MRDRQKMTVSKHVSTAEESACMQHIICVHLTSDHGTVGELCGSRIPLARDTSSMLDEKHHAARSSGRLQLPNQSGHED